MIAVLILLPIAINQLARRSLPWDIVAGNVSDWIGFYGSYIGAIIGGIVALGIVYLQSKFQQEEASRIKYINQAPIIIRVRYQIEKCHKSLRILKNTADNTPQEMIDKMYRELSEELPEEIRKEIAKIQAMGFLSRSTFQNVNAIEIKNEYWQNIDSIVDKKLLISLITFKEEYVNMTDILKTNIDKLQSQIKNIDLKISKIHTKERLSNNDRQTLEDLEMEKLLLVNKLKVAENDKKANWQRIQSGALVEASKEILSNLDNILKEIEKLEMNIN